MLRFAEFWVFCREISVYVKAVFCDFSIVCGLLLFVIVSLLCCLSFCLLVSSLSLSLCRSVSVILSLALALAVILSLPSCLCLCLCNSVSVSVSLSVCHPVSVSLSHPVAVFASPCLRLCFSRCALHPFHTHGRPSASGSLPIRRSASIPFQRTSSFRLHSAQPPTAIGSPASSSVSGFDSPGSPSLHPAAPMPSLSLDPTDEYSDGPQLSAADSGPRLRRPTPRAGSSVASSMRSVPSTPSSAAADASPRSSSSGTGISAASGTGKPSRNVLLTAFDVAGRFSSAAIRAGGRLPLALFRRGCAAWQLLLDLSNDWLQERYQLVQLRRQMASATTYDEWVHAAVKYDVVQDRVAWTLRAGPSSILCVCLCVSVSLCLCLCISVCFYVFEVPPCWVSSPLRLNVCSHVQKVTTTTTPSSSAV